VNNVIWELGLADVLSGLAQNKHRHLLNGLMTSKYAYSVPICSKTGEAVALAFRCILARNGGRPLAMRTDKYEFVNVKFRRLVGGHRNERVQESELNCAIVERLNRTLKSKLYKWITRNGCVDVPDK